MCTCQVGDNTLTWTQGKGLKEGCAISPVLFMVYYNVFIKELPRQHPKVLFLSYVADILFVANSPAHVHAVWHLGLKAHLDKMELHHRSKESIGRQVKWGEQPIQIHAPFFDYLGHYMAAHPVRGVTLEDFRQRALAELARYWGPTRWLGEGATAEHGGGTMFVTESPTAWRRRLPALCG